MRAARRHHHHRLHLRGFGCFRRLGPGLITGASDDDPSGIGTYSQVGAAFRYQLVWTALVSLPLASAVEETAGRLGLASGRGLAALIRARFPRPILFLAVALVSVANVFNIGADLGSMAAATRLLVPVPFTLMVLATAAVVVVTEIAVPYRSYTRVLRWLSLSLVSYAVVLFVVRVPWRRVFGSVLVPTLRWDRPYLAALIAIFGTTISPYLFFWQASEEVEEQHESAGLPDASHIRAMRADVVAGMGSGVAAMFAIMVACAATLGTKGVASIQTADQAAAALRPVAGSAAGLLFAAGIVGTGLLAVPVLAGSTGYAIAEALGWREGLSRRFSDARAFYGVIVAATVLGIALSFAGLNPIRALFYSAILNGLAAPPLLLLMLLLSRSDGAIGSPRVRRVSEALLVVSLIVMTGLPVVYLAR